MDRFLKPNITPEERTVFVGELLRAFTKRLVIIASGIAIAATCAISIPLIIIINDNTKDSLLASGKIHRAEIARVAKSDFYTTCRDIAQIKAVGLELVSGKPRNAFQAAEQKRDRSYLNSIKC